MYENETNKDDQKKQFVEKVYANRYEIASGAFLLLLLKNRGLRKENLKLTKTLNETNGFLGGVLEEVHNLRHVATDLSAVSRGLL